MSLLEKQQTSQRFFLYFVKFAGHLKLLLCHW